LSVECLVVSVECLVLNALQRSCFSPALPLSDHHGTTHPAFYSSNEPLTTQH
jgi:hypothetical protein